MPGPAPLSPFPVRVPDAHGCRDGSRCLAAGGEILPADPAEARLMAVIRFIGAAYETGDAACWDAAHDRAEQTLGTAEATLLVARAAALVRIIRVDRPDFNVLPPPCRRLSTDEAALLRLIRAAPSETATLRRAADILDNAGGIGLLAAAALAMGETACAEAAPAAVVASPGQSRLPTTDLLDHTERQFESVLI